MLIEPVLFAAARSAGDPAFAAFQAEHLPFAQALAEGRFADAAQMFHSVWGGMAWDVLPDRQRQYIIDRIALVGAQDDVLLGDAAGMLAYLRMESLGVPVLLIEGERSPPIIGAIHTELQRRLPQAELLVIPGAGHMAPITHPVDVAELINRFYARSQA